MDWYVEFKDLVRQQSNRFTLISAAELFDWSNWAATGYFKVLTGKRIAAETQLPDVDALEFHGRESVDSDHGQ